MEKIRLVGEQILGQKIGVKNLSWKMDKKLIKSVKKSRSENRCEKF